MDRRDGTKEALEARRFPFAVALLPAGSVPDPAPPAISESSRRRASSCSSSATTFLPTSGCIEEHLLAHAANPDPGARHSRAHRLAGDDDAKRGHGVRLRRRDAAVRVPATYRRLPSLDHRFFYTSNISLKRQFLVDAADAGIRFDPCFRHAAFEDSEFAFRLMPRGLRIRYADKARAAHDHWMDLDSFARREFGAGEMAVVFYRKHPGQDEQLQVRWVADLVEPASALLHPTGLPAASSKRSIARPTSLLRALAGSLEGLIAMDRQPGSSASVSLSGDRLRAALHNVLRVVFDVERTRGKLQEWFSMVDDPAKVRAAQTLASVMRKIEFLNLNAEALGPLQSPIVSIDSRTVAGLSGRIAQIEGLPAASARRVGNPLQQRMRHGLRQTLVNPFILSRAIKADRFIEDRLQATTRPTWLTNYRRLRSRIRRILTS